MGAKQPMNWPQAANNVGMRVVEKGQLPAVLVGLSVVILCIKLSSEDAATIAKDILHELASAHLLGWASSLLLFVLLLVLPNRTRNIERAELERVTKERNRLQEELAGRKLGSSKSK